MEKRKLGNTDLMVSKICLGTMIFGDQVTETVGHEPSMASIAGHFFA